jgi:hypothetical protein
MPARPRQAFLLLIARWARIRRDRSSYVFLRYSAQSLSGTKSLVMISDLSRLGLDHEQNSADWFLVTISAFVKEVSE